MTNSISPQEVLKYLHQDVYIKDPPEFTQKLITIERLDSVMKFDKFLNDDEFNKKLFLSYVLVSFNWLMKDIIAGVPDLYDLTNLQFKVKLAKGIFEDELSNHYIDMIHVFLASVAIFYCDKSSNALVEFNSTMGNILTQVGEFWQHDFREEFMKSKAPQKFLDNKVKLNSCDCGTCSCKE